MHPITLLDLPDQPTPADRAPSEPPRALASFPSILHATDDELIEFACHELHHFRRRIFEAHLAGCSSCRERLREMSSLVDESAPPRRTAAPRSFRGLPFGDAAAPVRRLRWAAEGVSVLRETLGQPVTFALLDSAFAALKTDEECASFTCSLMEPAGRRWFRACHALVHGGSDEGCSEDLFRALSGLPPEQARVARLHLEMARTLRNCELSIEAAAPALERFVSDSIPRALVLELARELRTEPKRIKESIGKVEEPGQVWHGDLRSAERTETAAGIFIVSNRGPREDEAVVVHVTLELIGREFAGRPAICLYPAPAFALWDRDEEFRGAEAAAAAAVANTLAEPGLSEVRWSIECPTAPEFAASVSGPSLGLALEFLLRRLLADPGDPFARVDIQDVAFTGAVGCGHVGKLVRKCLAKRLHTIVAPCQPLARARFKPRPDSPDIFSVRSGAVHLLMARTIEHAVELLAVDHTTRLQGIDLPPPPPPRDFVGREMLTARLVDFIRQTGSGYGVIVGGLGAGKTSFMQHLAQRLPGEKIRPLCHFIPEGGYASQGEYIGKSIYLRLRRKYATAEPPSWSDWPIARKLEELLKFLSEKHRGTDWKEVLLVDAANQAEVPDKSWFVPDVLPAELPEGVVCLVTSRNDVELWLKNPLLPKAIFGMGTKDDAIELCTDECEDIGRYLRQQQLFRLDEVFIEKIMHQDAPPMFFTVVKHLEALSRHDAPAALQEQLSNPAEWTKAPLKLIEQRLTSIRHRMDPHGDASEKIKQILGVVALVREPVTQAQLRDLRLWDEGLSSRILSEAASLFPLDLSDSFDQKPIRFDHPGYSEAITALLGEEGIKRCHRRIAERCRRWRKLFDSARNYAVRHWPAHLRRAGMWPELCEALTDFEYLKERLDASHGATPRDRASSLPEALAQRLTARLLRHIRHALEDKAAQLPQNQSLCAEVAAVKRVITSLAHVFQQQPELLPQELHNALAWEFGPESSLGKKIIKAIEQSPIWVLARTNRPAATSGSAQRYLCVGHRKAVNSVALSPDESLVASGSDDHSVMLWETRTGELHRHLRGHTAPVSSVAWSRDGGLLASAGQSVRLWDPASGASVGQWFVPGAVALVAFSPRADILAAACHDGSVHFYDPIRGQELGALRPGGPRICCMAFSLDGSLLAVGGSDGSEWKGAVELYDVAFRTHLRTVARAGYWINAVAFTHDSRIIVAGGGLEKGEVLTADVQTGAFLRAIPVHRTGVRALAIAHNGELVTGSHDCSIGLRHLATGEPIRTGLGQGHTVRSVAISRDARLVVSAGTDHSVTLWRIEEIDTPSSASRTREAHEETIFRSHLAPDGSFAITASRDGTARIFEPDSARPGRIFYERDEALNVAIVSPDGLKVAIASHDIVRIFDLATGAKLRSLGGHKSYVLDLAWTSDSKRLVSVSQDTTAMLWDADSGAWLRTFNAHSERLCAVAISPDDQLIATAGEDTTIHLWNLETGQHVNTLRGHARWILALDFSPDGRLLASAGRDEFIKLWDMNSGQVVHTLPVPALGISALKFAREHYLAAGGLDSMARIFDTRSGQRVASLACRDVVQALWFDEDTTEFRVVDRGGAELIPNIYVTKIMRPTRG